MKPAKEKYYRALFSVAAMYDLLLGIAFTFFPMPTFAWLGVSDQLPSFTGYITLPGALVMALGITYVLIARGDLGRNRDLILAGSLFKLAYAAVAFYYWAAGTLPHPAFAVFGVADALFFLLILECYWSLPRAFRN
ncbi:MAG TPA: hypothetical protein VFV81_10160 [Verrucomicrobiae bacterium]|nr:hypothetical protein [Verrucomicrobiae bacterium]